MSMLALAALAAPHPQSPEQTALAVTSPAADLVAKTKFYLSAEGGNGFLGPALLDVMAGDEFVLRGPLVGPVVGAEGYKSLMARIGPYVGGAFPDFKPNVQTCWADPEDPLSISCALYMTTGPMAKEWAGSPFGPIPASGRSVKSGGEVWNVIWTDSSENAKVKAILPGYNFNAHRGTDCGFGAIYAVACAAMGDTKEVYDTLNGFVNSTNQDTEYGSISSAPIPQWWIDYCQGPLCP